MSILRRLLALLRLPGDYLGRDTHAHHISTVSIAWTRRRAAEDARA